MRPVIANFGGKKATTSGAGRRLAPGVRLADDGKDQRQLLPSAVDGEEINQAIIGPCETSGGARIPATDIKKFADELVRIGSRGKVMLRWGALTPEGIAAAAATVDAALPPDADAETRAASIMHTLAANSTGPIQEAAESIAPAANAPRIVQTRPAGVRPAPKAAARAATQVVPHGLRRAVSPLQALSAQTTPPAALPPSPSPPPSVAAPVTAAKQPEFEVTIEREGFGSHVTFYHDVLVLPEVIVLVWDSRWRGPRYFPPYDANQPITLGLRITGDDRIFLAHPTGVQFPFQGYELCVLFVSKQVTTAGDDAPAADVYGGDDGDGEARDY